MVATRSKSKENQDMDPLNKDIPSPPHNEGEEEILYEEVMVPHKMQNFLR